jgi:hypothetical protein
VEEKIISNEWLKFKIGNRDIRTPIEKMNLTISEKRFKTRPMVSKRPAPIFLFSDG